MEGSAIQDYKGPLTDHYLKIQKFHVGIINIYISDISDNETKL